MAAEDWLCMGCSFEHTGICRSILTFYY